MKIKKYILILWIFLVIIFLLVLFIPFEQNQIFDMKEIDIFKFMETPDSRLIER